MLLLLFQIQMSTEMMQLVWYANKSYVFIYLTQQNRCGLQMIKDTQSIFCNQFIKKKSNIIVKIECTICCYTPDSPI